MSKIILYSARACPYAHRTRLVLAEKELDSTLVNPSRPPTSSRSNRACVITAF